MAAETGEGVDMDMSDPAHGMNWGIISESAALSLTVPWTMIFVVGFVLLEEQNLLADL